MKKAKTIYDLTQFENAPKLLKEWGNEPNTFWTFERLEKHATQSIIDGLRNRITIERGTNEGKQLYFEKDYIEAFGLPYTSSSDFAAIWNTNSQARAKYGEALYFRGVAIEAVTHDAILIFEDSSEKYFYFKEWQYIGYQEKQKELAQAVEYCQLVKDANKLKRKAFELLKAHNGCKLGAKTREKLNNALSDEAKRIDKKLTAFFSFEFDVKWIELYISYKSNNQKRVLFYFSKALIDNTLQLTEEEPNNKQEANGAQTYCKRVAMKPAIQKKAQELQALLNKYNELGLLINQRSEKTSSYCCDIERLTKYDF